MINQVKSQFNLIKQQTSLLNSYSLNNTKKVKVITRKPELNLIIKRNNDIKKEKNLRQFAGFFSPTHTCTPIIQLTNIIQRKSQQKQSINSINVKRKQKNFRASKENLSEHKIELQENIRQIINKSFKKQTIKNTNQKIFLNCTKIATHNQKKNTITSLTANSLNCKDKKLNQNLQEENLKQKQCIEKLSNTIMSLQCSVKQNKMKILKLEKKLKQQYDECIILNQHLQTKKQVIMCLQNNILLLKNRIQYYITEYAKEKQSEIQNLIQQNNLLKENNKYLELRNRDILDLLDRNQEQIKYLSTQLWIEKKKKYDDQNNLFQKQKSALIQRNKKLRKANQTLKDQINLLNKTNNKQFVQDDLLFELSPEKFFKEEQSILKLR